MELVPAGINERAVFDAKCRFAEGHRGIRITSDLDFDEWQLLLRGFTQLEGIIQFIIGDLLAYGMTKFAQGKYQQALATTGKAYQTLANWSSVSRAFPPGTRQFEVPYSHYQEVANLLDVEVRSSLLRSAENGGWTTKKLRDEKRKIAPDKETELYGVRIEVDGLAHAPINEQGVVFLFGLLSKDLGYSVEAVQQAFPDCIAKRKGSRGKTEVWSRVRIEFEFRSAEFKRHGHDASRCDLIVCWEHNWEECPIEVLELRSWVKEAAKADGIVKV